MAARQPLLSLPLRLQSNTNRLPSTCFAAPIPQHRNLHTSIKPPRIPLPTPFVPDATTFLTLIGRKLSAHASKIESWDALFSLTSTQLQELGIEEPRTRKYLLRWRDKFRNGEYGIGGDLKKVKDGVAEVRLVEVPVGAPADADRPAPGGTLTRSPGMMKRIINVDPGNPPISEAELRKATRVIGLKIKDSHTIYGPHVELVKGTNGKVAHIKVKEGMWEHRRGHKVDGGERRKAEVRAKRRAAERKAARS